MSRPEKAIDWKRVDELLAAGCLGTEIAAEFDMHQNTFYRRVEEKFNVSFTQYSTEKHAKGEQILREIQYLKAIGATDKGDNTLLIWLGKTRLKQRENDLTTAPPADPQIDKDNNEMEEKHRLRQEIEELKAKLENISQAGQELCGSDPQV